MPLRAVGVAAEKAASTSFSPICSSSFFPPALFLFIITLHTRTHTHTHTHTADEGKFSTLSALRKRANSIRVVMGSSLWRPLMGLGGREWRGGGGLGSSS